MKFFGQSFIEFYKFNRQNHQRCQHNNLESHGQHTFYNKLANEGVKYSINITVKSFYSELLLMEVILSQPIRDLDCFFILAKITDSISCPMRSIL